MPVTNPSRNEAELNEVLEHCNALRMAPIPEVELAA